MRLPPFCFRLPGCIQPPPVRSAPRSIVCRPPARPPFRHTDRSERKPSAPADHPAPFSLPDPPHGKTSARPHSISILPADPIPAERLPKKLRTYRIRTNLLARPPYTKHTARTAVSAADSPPEDRRPGRKSPPGKRSADRLPSSANARRPVPELASGPPASPEKSSGGESRGLFWNLTKKTYFRADSPIRRLPPQTVRRAENQSGMTPAQHNDPLYFLNLFPNINENA